MITRKPIRAALAAGVAAFALAISSLSYAAATIVIVNFDNPGEGFNDPTPAAPVGGNPGVTLGQQRVNAFQYAANRWGATLTSVETIFVAAFFDNTLPCTPTGAVLGAAGALVFHANFPGAPKAGTWYPAPLADKLAGADLAPADFDLVAFFNPDLGKPDCLNGSPFYLGLDANHGTAIDFVAVLLHEFGHGLGFSVFPTTSSTGVREQGLPSVWEGFMFDNTAGLTWLSMATNAERAASAINPRKLAWNGPNVTGSSPSVLSPGTPQLLVTGLSTANGVYEVGAASFGPVLSPAGVTGDIMPVVDQANGAGLACLPLSPVNALAVRGNIALIDRGTCSFPEKVKNAQNAGARAVIIADNAAGSPPPGLGGADATITIPAARITLADATKIKAALAFRSRTRSGVIGTLNLDMSRLAGADAFNRVLLYTPNPFQGGSSVSHWDTSAFRNLLMEPSINADLTHSVIPPEDLTFRLFQDLGW